VYNVRIRHFTAKLFLTTPLVNFISHIQMSALLLISTTLHLSFYQILYKDTKRYEEKGDFHVWNGWDFTRSSVYRRSNRNAWKANQCRTQGYQGEIRQDIVAPREVKRNNLAKKEYYY